MNTGNTLTAFKSKATKTTETMRDGLIASGTRILTLRTVLGSIINRAIVYSALIIYH